MGRPKYFVPTQDDDKVLLTLTEEQVQLIKAIDARTKALDQTLDTAIRSHSNNMIRINEESNKLWDDIRDVVIENSPETRRSYDGHTLLVKERDNGEVIVTIKKV